MVGSEAIGAHLKALQYGAIDLEHGCVDIQSGVSETVIVMVTGFLSFSNGPVRAFAQTFTLAPSAPGSKAFYVRNDCLRVVNAAPAPAVAAAPVAAALAVEAPVAAPVAPVVAEAVKA